MPKSIDRTSRDSLRNRIPFVYGIDGSTVKVQKFTGEYDKLNPRYPVNNTQSRFRVVGTDLGTPVEHGGKLYFLFGDTYFARNRETWMQI